MKTLGKFTSAFQKRNRYFVLYAISCMTTKKPVQAVHQFMTNL